VTNAEPLFQRDWPVPQPRASILIVHGYAEHCGRYDHLARRFNDAGFTVRAYDHYAHGQSPGALGYVADFDRLVTDLAAIAKAWWTEPGHPAKRFIFGHSMGGLVTALAVERGLIAPDAVVFSGAAVDLGDVSPILRVLSPVLSRILPRVPAAELEDEAISRIEDEVDAYSEDPLVYHGPIYARTGYEMMRAAQHARDALPSITLPFLALHGAADRLIPARASQTLYDRAASTDKTLKIYEDAYHEVFNDLPREQFIQDTLDWLEKH
jgi:acylglycerol lipase